MPLPRRTLVLFGASCVAIAAGAVAAEMLPPAYVLFGVSRPVAVTLLGFAPVVVVAVGVGCVLAYGFGSRNARDQPRAFPLLPTFSDLAPISRTP
jgi:hypothetical protein